MKHFPAVVFISILLSLHACSGPSRSKSSTKVVDNTDSVEFYEADVQGRQVSYKKDLLGKWKVETMQRQQRAGVENLNGVTLTFNDSAFTGKAPCNSIGGGYQLKGTGISFFNIFSTKMACEQLEQEYAYLKLLEKTVSAFTVEGSTLLLRDGSSNIVFRCVKE